MSNGNKVRGGRRRDDKLKVRQADFDAMRSEGGKGSSKWVKTQAGKNQMFHRPGSHK